MLNQYRTLFSAPNWRTDSAALPSFWQEWLLHTASLTEKLQQHCPDLAVQITQQGWHSASSAFAKFDETPTACWQREVCLTGLGVPLIFAQTTLPKATIKAVAQAVPTLGTTPIGLWLFPQNPVRQSLMWQRDPTTGLYARRSTLLLNGYPLTITELFLPDFSTKMAHSSGK